MGGGALGSENVSKLGSKEVSKTKIAEPLQEDPFFMKSKDFGKRRQVRDDRYVYNFAKPCHRALIARSVSKSRKVAFTLAEVLITLGIIGVVAALTLPSVIERHQKLETVTKLKKVYSTLSQMQVSSFADNGLASDLLTIGDNVDAEKTEQYFKTFWVPYLKSPIIANNNKGFYSKGDPYKQIDGSASGMTFGTHYNLGRVMLSTQDGMIYTVWVMGWEHHDDGTQTAKFTNPYNVYVDINGTKQPNRYGRDVFLFKIYPENNVVKPNCGVKSTQSINDDCSKTGVGYCCAAKIMNDGWEIKDDYPW